MSQPEGQQERSGRGAAFMGRAGTWPCGDWCRHFESFDERGWPGFGRCLHPLSLRHGEVFRLRRECAVGEVEQAPDGP